MQKSVKFSVSLSILILLSLCSRNERLDEVEILSLIYNTQIGNQEHFGSAPPVPPLSPDFDELKRYESKTKVTQELIPRE